MGIEAVLGGAAIASAVGGAAMNQRERNKARGERKGQNEARQRELDEAREMRNQRRRALMTSINHFYEKMGWGTPYDIDKAMAMADATTAEMNAENQPKPVTENVADEIIQEVEANSGAGAEEGADSEDLLDASEQTAATAAKTASAPGIAEELAAPIVTRSGPSMVEDSNVLDPDIEELLGQRYY